MRSILLLFGILVSSTFSHAHTELLASLEFSEYEGSLYMRASLSKNSLIKVLKAEGDCLLEEMIEKCGSEYFLDQVQVRVNGQPVKFKKEEYKLEQNFVEFGFRCESIIDRFETIQLNSTYLLAYNDHAILNAVFKIGDHSSSYNLNHKRREILVKLNE